MRNNDAGRKPDRTIEEVRAGIAAQNEGWFGDHERRLQATEKALGIKPPKNAKIYSPMLSDI